VSCSGLASLFWLFGYWAQFFYLEHLEDDGSVQFRIYAKVLGIQRGKKT